MLGSTSGVGQSVGLARGLGSRLGVVLLAPLTVADGSGNWRYAKQGGKIIPIRLARHAGDRAERADCAAIGGGMSTRKQLTKRVTVDNADAY